MTLTALDKTQQMRATVTQPTEQICRIFEDVETRYATQCSFIKLDKLSSHA